MHQLQLVSQSPLCSQPFNSQSRSWYSYIFSRFFLNYIFFLIILCGRQNSLFGGYSCFYWLSQGLVVLPRLGDLFAYQNPREFCTSHSPAQIPGSAHTTCSSGPISLSCITPIGLPLQPSRVSSNSLFLLFYYIRLYDGSFYFYHHTTYTFVASYLFLIQRNSSL